MSETLKEGIVRILDEVYLSDSSKKTKYQKDFHNDMANWIVDHMEKGVEYHWGVYHWNFQDLTNYIWMAYSGGTTAEYCAQRMVDELGIEFKESVRR